MQWNAALDDHQILGVMSDEGRGLLRGCYWGEYTRHGVLDIDPGSKYHKPEALTKLLQDFSLLGLKLVPYQSSERGGWHLYLFFDRDVLSKEVEKIIRDYLRVRGYEIKGGTLEVFPSGNALRLPLQAGFAWLGPDAKIEVLREELTQDQALALFFNDLHENRNNWIEAKAKIESQIKSAGAAYETSAQEHQNAVTVDGLDKLFQKGIDWEKWQRGRSYWHLGLTEKSQRHDAIVCVGHYLWYGDEAAGLEPLPKASNKTRRAELITRWLEEKHNGQSEDINRGRWGEVSADIGRATAWKKQEPVIPEYEPYRLTDRLIKRLQWLYNKTGKLWTIEELAKANIDRSQDARQRIAVAVAQLEAEGMILTRAAVARRAKAHRSTVVKNLDLLTLCLGEYIAGGEGAVSPSLLLSGSVCSFPGSSVKEVCSFFPASGRSQEVFGQEGVKPACIKSSDQSESFQVLSRGDVAFSFSEKSELVDTEPSGVIVVHECTLVDPPNSSVAPLFSCLAESQPESPQYQAQALRVAAQGLTPGPRLSGIQALRHVTAGGILLFLPVCYSTGTKYGIRARAEASSERGALSSFGAAKEDTHTILDATNNNFLATAKSSYSSGNEDKFLLIARTANIINFPVMVPARTFYAGLPVQVAVSKCDVDSSSVTLLGLVKCKKTLLKSKWQRCRQRFSKQYRYLTARAWRGPPPAHRALLLVYELLILIVVLRVR
jgi:hypothetical protein